MTVWGGSNSPKKTILSLQARSQAGATGAIATSEGPITPSDASLCTLCSVYLGYSSTSLLPCLVDYIANDFALPILRLYRGAQTIAILLIFSP